LARAQLFLQLTKGNQQMITVAKCAAVASVIALTAGSAAWAQNYTTNPGTQGSYSSNPGSYTYNPSQGYSHPSQGSWSGTQGTATQGYPSQGTYNSSQGNTNQGSWSSGMQGTSTPYGGQSYSQAGYGAGNISTYQQAEQELARYGYSNIHDLKAMQGWSADAMRNGERVHVILGENGLVATFPGR
jgi:hypothetical protein